MEMTNIKSYCAICQHQFQNAEIKSKKVRLFAVPKNRKRLWECSVGFELYDEARICQKHFDHHDFIIRPERCDLLPMAVPKISPADDCVELFSKEVRKSFKGLKGYHEIIAQSKEMVKSYLLTLQIDDPRILGNGVDLLIDPRTLCNSEINDKVYIWKQFLNSIFYVGRGNDFRTAKHLNAAKHLTDEEREDPINQKFTRIVEIWESGRGVICLHLFNNISVLNAATRKTVILEALTLNSVTNQNLSDAKNTVADWPKTDQIMLGIGLLDSALTILTADGGSELRLEDVE